MSDSVFWEKIKHNAEVAAKSGSSWVIAAGVAACGLWANMDAAQQNAFVAGFPWLKGNVALITVTATWLIAKLKPSNSVSSQTQVLLDEIARLRVNAQLAKAGAQPILPPAAPVSVPVPAPEPVAPTLILPDLPPAPVEAPVAPPVVEAVPASILAQQAEVMTHPDPTVVALQIKRRADAGVA